MKTQTISQNSFLYLQSHPHHANTCRESFEILQNYLQRTVNLLGKRLFELTVDQANLAEIGKAQRALSGSLANFYKVLGTLADIREIEYEPIYDALAGQNPDDLDPDRFVVNAPEPEAQSSPTPQPDPEPVPQPEPAPPEHTQPDSPPQPESQAQTPSAPPLYDDSDLPPLNPLSDDFEDVIILYETRLKAAIEEIQNGNQPPPTPLETTDPPEPQAQQPTPPPKIDPPKKYNTRRKRKDPKYLRKLQKRHTPKQKAA